MDAVLTVERKNSSDRRLSIWAGVVIALQVLALGWAVSSTWFKHDDFVVLYRTTSEGGFPGSMLTVHGGHLVPGIVGVFWVLRSIFGMQWWPFVAVIATTQAVCSYLTWRVFKSFFGLRPISVLLLVVYAASVLTVGANMISMSAVQYLPTQLAFPATILLLQRYSRQPTLRIAILSAVPVLFAGFFFEKAATIVPFVVILCAITPLTESSAATWSGRVRELRIPLALFAIATSAYAIFFRVFTDGSAGQSSFTLHALSSFNFDPFTKNLVTSLFGGPGRFWGDGSTSGPSGFEVRASFAMFCLLFVWSMIRNWRSIKYWVLLLAMACVNLALIAFASRNFVQLATRYMSDLVFPLVLLVGFAVVGNTNDEHDGYSPLARKAIQRSASLGLAAIIVAGLAIVAHSAKSQSALVADIKYAPGKSYVETARRSTGTLDSAPTIIPQASPVDIINQYFGLIGMSSTRVVLSPADLNVRFGSVTENPFMVLSDGSVVPARFDSISKAIPTGTECLNKSGPSTTTLKMDSSPFVWGWYGRMRYIAAEASKAGLVWSGAETVVDLEPGSHDIYFPIGGGGETLSVSLDSNRACLHEIEFLQLRVDY